MAPGYGQLGYSTGPYGDPSPVTGLLSAAILSMRMYLRGSLAQESIGIQVSSVNGIGTESLSVLAFIQPSQPELSVTTIASEVMMVSGADR